MNCVDDVEGSDFENFGVQGAHEGAASGHRFVGVEGRARLDAENLLDERLETRNSESNVTNFFFTPSRCGGESSR